jgi:hypothetical protein
MHKGRKHQQHMEALFYKARKATHKFLQGKILTALSKASLPTGGAVTAGMVRNGWTRQRITEGEAYNTFSALRNSPPYYKAAKKDLIALSRSMQQPWTFFFTGTCNPETWFEVCYIA